MEWVRPRAPPARAAAPGSSGGTTMAHFVRMSDKLRVSSEDFDVDVGKTLDLGLWGFLDFQGRELSVVSTNEAVATVTAKGKQGLKTKTDKDDLSVWQVKGVTAGDAVIEARTAEGAVW